MVDCKQNQCSTMRGLKGQKCYVKADFILRLKISEVMSSVIFVTILKLGSTQNGRLAVTRPNQQYSELEIVFFNPRMQKQNIIREAI